MPEPGKALLTAARSARLGARGHFHVDALDHLAKARVEAIAGLRQRYLDLAQDPARIAAEHQDAIAHQHRLLDVVSHQDDALDGHPAFGPEIEEVGAQSLRRQYIERRERLVHEQDVRMHDQRARESHPLAHAARQLARIGGLEAVETDEIDRRQRALTNLGARQVLRLESERDVLEHREPGKQREALEHHRDSARGPRHGLARDIATLPGARLGETRDQAQQRRLAGARAPEQAHDLPLAELEVHALEHQQFLAVGLRKGLAHVGTLQQR